MSEWIDFVVYSTLIVLFFKELLITSFDRVGAEAMGIKVFWVDILLLLMICLTIIVSLRAVGNILVVAMLVTPAATARQLTERLTVMVLLSASIGAMSGILGLFISYHQDVAAGGTIVLVATALFTVTWLFSPAHGVITTGLLRRQLSGAIPAESAVLFESPQIRPPAH